MLDPNASVGSERVNKASLWPVCGAAPAPAGAPPGDKVAQRDKILSRAPFTALFTYQLHVLINYSLIGFSSRSSQGAQTVSSRAPNTIFAQVAGLALCEGVSEGRTPNTAHNEIVNACLLSMCCLGSWSPTTHV